MSPSRVDLRKLRTPLEEGERLVVDFLDRTLPIEWEIYVQPHLNGCRPDVVLLNPQVGIAVLEVKDWDLDAVSYHRPAKGNRIIGRVGGQTYAKLCPAAQLRRYREEIYNLYCPRLASHTGLAAIAAGLVFPFADERKLLDLFGAPKSKYDFIVGAQSFRSGEITEIFPPARYSSSTLMRADLADDLRSWLLEPDYSAEQREPLLLDPTQEDLASTRTSSGLRRIRGPAGAGKSLVVAARAAKLANGGHDVLVVSFNITLLNYLRDLCSRASPTAKNDVIWLNFHSWCKRVASELDLDAEYQACWEEHRNGGESAFHSVPRLLLAAVRKDPPLNDLQYDAILVDEGQDFDPLWWSLLRCFCRDGGEMLLAADATQDIYGSAQKWTDEAMSGAGFRGPWNELTVSYRLPSQVAERAALFAECYLPELNRQLPEVAQTELNLSAATLRWIRCEEENLVARCLREIQRMFLDEGERVSVADITVLVDSVRVGSLVASELEVRNIRTINTFPPPDSNDVGEDRRKKVAFWKGDSRVKVTTLHSFKGWEGRRIVLVISQVKGPKDLALLYAGLTRLKAHPRGSTMTIVCADRSLDDFGELWPTVSPPRGCIRD